jgi:hypothetical protein
MVYITTKLFILDLINAPDGSRLTAELCQNRSLVGKASGNRQEKINIDRGLFTLCQRLKNLSIKGDQQTFPIRVRAGGVSS